MIDIHSNYDNMHKNGIFYALICINNHVNSFINCLLSLFYDCSKVFTTVTHFIKEIATQYSTTPKILYIDNKLDFVQTSLCTFRADHGIIHQTTCPHTS